MIFVIVFQRSIHQAIAG